MDDKMIWPPYVAAFFGVGLLRRRSFLSSLKRPEKPKSIEIFYSHITMSWPSILDRPEAFSTVV
jgi:hypothetical protein